MRKRTALLILLVLVLAVIFCLRTPLLFQNSQAHQEKESSKQEQKEKNAKMAEAQKQLLSQNELETQEQESQKTSRQTVAVLEEENDPGLEGEAQIEKPARMSKDEWNTEGVEGMDDLKIQLESMLAGYEGDWSVYAYDLSDKEYLEINSHAVKAASLIKLYIMGAVLEQIEAGNLTEDENIHYLLSAMITVSDNESANELVRLLSPDGRDHAAGMEVVNAFAKAYGYEDTSQGRDLKDVRDTPPPGENYTSVKDCGFFLKRVYEGTCISPEASAKILELLKQQTRTWKIPAGVPEGVVTANKTGELSDTENDVAVIYSPGGDYILCITSTNLADTASAQANIVEISSTVYQYMDT